MTRLVLFILTLALSLAGCVDTPPSSFDEQAAKAKDYDFALCLPWNFDSNARIEGHSIGMASNELVAAYGGIARLRAMPRPSRKQRRGLGCGQ